MIRGGAIGDFICTMPVVAALRQALPETPLSLLSYDRVLPLAGATGSFAHLRSIERRAFAGFFAAQKCTKIGTPLRGLRSELDKEWVEFIIGLEPLCECPQPLRSAEAAIETHKPLQRIARARVVDDASPSVGTHELSAVLP